MSDQTLTDISDPAFAPPSEVRPAAAPRRPSTALLGFVGSWAAYLVVLELVPTPDGMSPAAQATLATVAWACVTWITEAVPIALTGLQIPVLLVLGGAVPSFAAAASGFVSEASFICLVSFLMAAVIQCVGLDRRITLTILHRARVSTVRGVIWGLFVVDSLLSFIIPGSNTRGALLVPLVQNINRLLGDTPAARAAKKAIVVHSLVYGSMVCGLVVMTAGLQNLILVGLFKAQLGIEISYFQWIALRWPYLGLALITQWWIRRHFGCSDMAIPGETAAIDRDYRALAPTRGAEWRTIAVLVLTAAAWATERLHHVPSHVVAVVGLSALFYPGLLPIDWAQVSGRTMWGTFLTLCGAVSLSAAMASSGLGLWLADLVAPLAAGHSWWVTLLIFYAAIHVIRLGLLSNVASVALLAPILLAVAARLGFHPIAFTMLVVDASTFAFILPMQVTVGVIAYSTGTFSVAEYARVGWVTVLISIAYGLLVMAPWYALMGVPLWNAAAPWPF
ncbi:MAG TPA: SLC13 family permease [Xanthobacteraceae bacterium]|nr:SLC13 family permease [Xanthobacteraceae bacterium]